MASRLSRRCEVGSLGVSPGRFAERSGSLGVSPSRFAERSGPLGVSPGRFAERSLRHPGFAHSCILAFALRAALDCKAGSFGPGSPLAYGLRTACPTLRVGLRPGGGGGAGWLRWRASGTGPRAAQRPRRSRGAFGTRGPVPFTSLACEGQDGFTGVKRERPSAGLRRGCDGCGGAT